MYNHVENCIRNLKALKLDTSGYGSLLIPILKDRLPDDIKMVIARNFGNNTWTLDKVLEYFNDELTAQENCSTQSSTRSQFNEHDKSRKMGYYTTSGLLSQTGKGSCVYCNKDGHFHSKCTNVSSPESRSQYFVGTIGVLFVLIKDILQKIAHLLMFVEDVGEANIIFLFARLIPIELQVITKINQILIKLMTHLQNKDL